jgi:hypothetical protein
MAGWTPPHTFTGGEMPTAAQWIAYLSDNLAALNGYVLKGSDQPRTSNTTLGNDTDLLYALPAVGTYVFDIWLYATSAANAAGDLKVALTFPAGTMRFSALGPDPAIASASVASGVWFTQLAATSGSSSISVGLSTNTNMIWVHGMFTATATGTLQLQWAQDTSNASSSTVKAGSHMRVTQVA